MKERKENWSSQLYPAVMKSPSQFVSVKAKFHLSHGSNNAVPSSPTANVESENFS